MQLNLTDTQVHALKTAIDSYYSDLREEIYHTDAYDDRQALKMLEQELEGIRELLEPGWTARTGADRDNAPATASAPPADAALAGDVGSGQGTPPVGMPPG